MAKDILCFECHRPCDDVVLCCDCEARLHPDCASAGTNRDGDPAHRCVGCHRDWLKLYAPDRKSLVDGLSADQQLAITAFCERCADVPYRDEEGEEIACADCPLAVLAFHHPPRREDDDDASPN